MRKNFAQVLKEARIDIKEEYNKLLRLYEDSYLDDIVEYFPNFYFRGTCITLEEFNRKHHFKFEYLQRVSIDDLLTFSEYFYNMLIGLRWCGFESGWIDGISPQYGIDLINKIMEEIGYMSIQENNLTVFVEKSQAAIAVSELLEGSASYKVIFYNHSSLKGNLEEKKSILLQLANLLEPQREILKNENKELEHNLFFMFNNMQIRHNNTDPNDKSKYKPYVANMKQEELEKWYDDTYQMCLLAFLELDNIDRTTQVHNLIQSIK